jgi:hypothetical protein
MSASPTGMLCTSTSSVSTATATIRRSQGASSVSAILVRAALLTPTPIASAPAAISSAFTSCPPFARALRARVSASSRYSTASAIRSIATPAACCSARVVSKRLAGIPAEAA